MTFKRKKMSEDTKRKISISNTGRIISDETKLKFRLANLGKRLSEETKRKISIGNKGKKLSEDTKNKMSLSKKGKKVKERTPEHNKNLSLSLIKRYDLIGRKEHKRYIHNCNSKEYNIWRISVFQRDSYTCQTCGVRGVYLEAHHIKSWAKHPEIRLVLENGVTLCRECHKLTDNYKNNK